MGNRQSKNTRTLDMYARLCEGKVLNKAEEAERFGVDERSIQRDIDDIRAFLDERAVANSSDTRSIAYDRGKKGFLMVGTEGSMMSNSEILAVSKILLESRAFRKDEINSILDKLISGCVSQKNRKLVSDLIANERFHYVELKHNLPSPDMIWALGEAVKSCTVVELSYRRHMDGVQTIKRCVEPVAITFSDYYFYLIGYITRIDENGEPEAPRKSHPAVYRIDRIDDYKILDKKFRIPYRNQFEDGEFRKRVQFMFPGELTRVTFQYKGPSPEAILDRLPTAEIRERKGDTCLIEAEVFGTGILMWLLSQGDAIEVLKPQKLRDEMKTMLQKMLEKYEDKS